MERHEKILERVINAIPKKTSNCFLQYKEKTIGELGRVYDLTLQTSSLGSNTLETDDDEEQAVGAITDVRSRLCPDLILVSPSLKQIHIIDVTTAMPSSNRMKALEEARKRKIEKYDPVAKAFEQKGYEIIQNDAIVMGSNGAFLKSNRKVLEKLGISKTFANKMCNYLVYDVINCSARIYTQRKKGLQQVTSKEDNPTSDQVHGSSANTRSQTNPQMDKLTRNNPVRRGAGRVFQRRNPQRRTQRGNVDSQHESSNQTRVEERVWRRNQVERFPNRTWVRSRA